jgi:hypothetical protein
VWPVSGAHALALAQLARLACAVGAPPCPHLTARTVSLLPPSAADTMMRSATICLPAGASPRYRQLAAAIRYRRLAGGDGGSLPVSYAARQALSVRWSAQNPGGMANDLMKPAGRCFAANMAGACQ